MFIVYIFRGHFVFEMLVFSRYYFWPNMHFPSGLGLRASPGKVVLIAVCREKLTRLRLIS